MSLTMVVLAEGAELAPNCADGVTHWRKNRGNVGAEIDNNLRIFGIDTPHLRNLGGTLLGTGLVDAHGVDPNHADAPPWAHEPEQVPAVASVQHDVPVRADVNRMLPGAIAVLSGPAVRDCLVLGAVVKRVGL